MRAVDTLNLLAHEQRAQTRHRSSNFSRVELSMLLNGAFYTTLTTSLQAWVYLISTDLKTRTLIAEQLIGV